MIKVLIVEDDIVQSRLYREWLASGLRPSSGVLVQLVSNGQEAASILNSNMFDVTVMDLALPYIPGPELIERYRANMGRLLVASSFADFYGRMRPNALVDGVLQKPLNQDMLIHELKRFIRSDVYADQRPDFPREVYTAIA